MQDPNEGGVILVVTYRAASGNEAQVAENLVNMAHAVGREEPGCLAFDVVQGEDDPAVFVLYEHYTDEAALTAHRETPHYLDLVKHGTWPLLESREPVRMRFLAGARLPGEATMG